MTLYRQMLDDGGEVHNEEQKSADCRIAAEIAFSGEPLRFFRTRNFRDYSEQFCYLLSVQGVAMRQEGLVSAANSPPENWISAAQVAGPGSPGHTHSSDSSCMTVVSGRLIFRLADLANA